MEIIKHNGIMVTWRITDISTVEREKAKRINDIHMAIFQNLILSELIKEIPIIRVFFGYTPMKEWISKCKPYRPLYTDIIKTGTSDSVSVKNIEFLPIQGMMRRYMDSYIDNLMAEIREKLGIPRIFFK